MTYIVHIRVNDSAIQTVVEHLREVSRASDEPGQNGRGTSGSAGRSIT
ncbi:hypothetical protein [Paenibacillus sp. Z3-2]